MAVPRFGKLLLLPRLCPGTDCWAFPNSSGCTAAGNSQSFPTLPGWEGILLGGFPTKWVSCIQECVVTDKGCTWPLFREVEGLWTTHSNSRRGQTEKGTNSVGFILPNSWVLHHRWLHPGLKLACSRTRHKKLSDELFYRNIFPRSPHLRNVFFSSTTTTTWELVQSQVEWNEANSTFCSYPFGEAECEGERQTVKCFAQGGVTFPEITMNYSKIWSTAQFFCYVFDCLYTISGNTFRTGKPYHHLQTVEPRSQGKLSQKSLQFYTSPLSWGAQGTFPKEVNTLLMLHRLNEMSAACTPVSGNYLIFLTEISNL